VSLKRYDEHIDAVEQDHAERLAVVQERLRQAQDAIGVQATATDLAKQRADRWEAENRTLRQRVAELEALLNQRPKTFKHIKERE
jgi:hypothetical protein